MKGAAQFFLDTLVQEPSLGLPGHQPVELPGARTTTRASACAPGPTMDNQILRDLFNGVRAGRARCSASTPTSAPGSWPPATGCRR